MTPLSSLLLLLGSHCDPSTLERLDTKVQSEPSVEVLVLVIHTPHHRRGAVLFTHGAGSPSSAQWDLSPPHYSFMRKMACAGFDAYAVDVRGFGGSTRTQDARAQHVMPDVAAAVRHAKKASKVERVHLIGWSWGSLVAGMYAGRAPGDVDRLILISPVYDRKWPKRHQSRPGWYSVKRETFFSYFDETKEERAVLESFVDGMFRFEKGDELKLPQAPYMDLYGEDAPIWDASKVESETLVVHGDQDRASRTPHAQKLFEDLKNARVRRYVVIGGAGHFLFRTRVYRQLHAVVLGFLGE